MEDSEKEEIRKYLLRYAAISLREESGVKIIEELGISGSVHVLDPTLQLDAAFGIGIYESLPKNIMYWFIN